MVVKTVPQNRHYMKLLIESTDPRLCLVLGLDCHFLAFTCGTSAFMHACPFPVFHIHRTDQQGVYNLVKNCVNYMSFSVQTVSCHCCL